MEENDGAAAERPSIDLWSFGFKYGTMEANLLLDARFLPNPFYVPELRHLTGRDAPCSAHVFKDPSSLAFADAAIALVLGMERAFAVQGKKSLKVAIGCTGGQHRSVALVELIATALRENGLTPEVHHKELERIG
jgi:UPF0042 nucleotide-binding protein